MRQIQSHFDPNGHPWCGAAILLLFCTLSCHTPPKVSEGTPVILISIDTLRSDRLPVYGYDKVKTPALDNFAKEAMVFDHAFAQVPLTLPSHASMLTGKLPTNHGVRDNIGFFLPEKEITLAERLKEHGYQTGAVVSSMVLRHEVGLAQGFDFYEDQLTGKTETFVRTYAQRVGGESLEIAKKWLATQGRDPFFLLFHLYDPHFPYTPPEPFASKYDSGYDGEIAYTDSLLADLFALLKKRGLYDRALMIVTSDHGEGLGDHEEMEHGMFVYREAIQVPLMVKFPNSANAGTRNATPVALMDIAPSILASLGIESWANDGKVIFGPKAPPRDRPIYSESQFAQIHYGWHPQKSTVQDRWHYIAGKEELFFDYQNDPGERTNLFGKQRIPIPMRSLLDSVGTGASNRAEISEEDKALLSSLGYAGLTSTNQEILALSASEIVRLKDSFNACHHLISQGKKAEAKAKLQEMVQEYPTMMDARVLLAVLLRDDEAFTEIEHLLAEALANDPGNLRVITYLAEAKFRLGDLEGAQKLADKALSLDAQFAGEVLMPLYLQAGMKDKAEAIAGLMLTNRSHPNAIFVQARKEFEADHFEKTIEKTDDALAENIDDPELKAKLLILKADALIKLDRNTPALKSLEEALKLDPQATYGRVLFAATLEKNGDFSAAEAQLRQGIDQEKDALELLLPMVRLQLKQGNIESAQQFAGKALDHGLDQAAPPLSFFFLKYGTPQAAVVFANRVLSQAPNSPHAQFLLGWVAHAKKDFQNATLHLGKAVEGAKQIRDGNLLSEAAFYLGDSHASLRQAREAAEAFQLATQVRPDYPEAQVSLAAIYALAGRTDDARDIIDHWLTQFPTPENRKAASALLQKFGLDSLAEQIPALR